MNVGKQGDTHRAGASRPVRKSDIGVADDRVSDGVVIADGRNREREQEQDSEHALHGAFLAEPFRLRHVQPLCALLPTCSTG